MAGKRKKQAVSTRPPFEYLPVLPQHYDRYVTLTCKLVSWSYLNFTVRLPIQTPLAHVRQVILNNHKNSISSARIQTRKPQLADFSTAFDVMTEYDYQLLTAAVNSDLKLYKGSPLSWPALPDDGALTLADVGFTGACVDEPELFADLFYDFTACRIIGNGKEKV